MLGKRNRPPLKRNTSMTEFTLDFNGGDMGVEYQPLDPHNSFNGGFDQRTLVPATAACATLRPHRRNSVDFVETAYFLRVCSLCQRRLIPGHDIYMYRGDAAFCSLECRQRQITRDEKKQIIAVKKGTHNHHPQCVE